MCWMTWRATCQALKVGLPCAVVDVNDLTHIKASRCRLNLSNLS